MVEMVEGTTKRGRVCSITAVGVGVPVTALPDECQSWLHLTLLWRLKLEVLVLVELSEHLRPLRQRKRESLKGKSTA